MSFHLPPFPPQKLRCKSEPGLVRITWTKPRGWRNENENWDFPKYRLNISLVKSPRVNLPQSETLKEDDKIHKQVSLKEVWPSRDLEEYEEKRLLPGEAYHVTLASMTSYTQSCLRPPTRTLLTKPKPAGNLKVNTEEWSCVVRWSPPPPPGHSCLDGYRVEVRKAEDNSTVQPLLVKSVKRSEESVELKVSELGLVSNYRLSLFSTASRNVSSQHGQENEKLPNLEILRESSLPVETSFTLGPLAPTNLRLESSSHSSLKVKWDPTQEHDKSSYLVSTNPNSKEIKVHGNNSATISKLGSGQLFRVSVVAAVTAGNKHFESKAVSIEAPTKPMPPTNLKILREGRLADGHKMKLVWSRSSSASVTRYELTVRSEDEYHKENYLVDVNNRKDQNEPVQFLAPMTMDPDIDYKINIYSLFEHGGVLVRSDPLHARVRNGTRAYLLKSKVQQASKSMSDLNIHVRLNIKIYFINHVLIWQLRWQSSSSGRAAPIWKTL